METLNINKIQWRSDIYLLSAQSTDRRCDWRSDGRGDRRSDGRVHGRRDGKGVPGKEIQEVVGGIIGVIFRDGLTFHHERTYTIFIYVSRHKTFTRLFVSGYWFSLMSSSSVTNASSSKSFFLSLSISLSLYIYIYILAWLVFYGKSTLVSYLYIYILCKQILLKTMELFIIFNFIFQVSLLFFLCRDLGDKRNVP